MNTTKNETNFKNIKSTPDGKAQIGKATNNLLNESKKKANELYDESIDKLNGVEDTLNDYSNTLRVKVMKNPMSAVLIAAGVGFIMSKLRR